jgi:hypothetical protein
VSDAAKILYAQARKNQREVRLMKEYILIVGMPTCAQLHHDKKQRHGTGQPCPAVGRLVDIASELGSMV